MTTGVNTTMAETVDKLGKVKAQISPLVSIEKDLKDMLCDAGPGAYEGKLFRATVSETIRTGPDAEKMEAKLRELGVSEKWFTANSKMTAFLSVRCVARTGKAVAA